MAYVVGTGLVSVPVAGAWRRLGALCTDGLLVRVDDRQLIGQLEELGIPRYLYGLVRTVQSWQRASVPPDVAFALWMLREVMPTDGGIPRRTGLAAEDTGPTIRYLQLALDAGETAQTDPSIPRLATWLVSQQAADGGIVANLQSIHGEVGTTARVLRLLRQIPDPQLRQPIEDMRHFLLSNVVQDHDSRWWSYSPHDSVPIVGATALATLALIELDRDTDTVEGAIRFLLAAQDPCGAWSEVPGHSVTLHNTFNVVRTLHAARRAGMATAEIDAALERATAWYRRVIQRRRPRIIFDMAHSMRLAALLGIDTLRSAEKVALRLCRMRARFLDPGADLYAETEIAAIAVLECSRALDAESGPATYWPWRWTMPNLPPPFLCRSTYLYELLYGMHHGRRWIRTVDFLVRASIVDHAAGLLLGTIAALGFVDDYVTGALSGVSGPRGVLTVSVIMFVALAWLAIKSCTYSSLPRALSTSLSSAAAATVMTWMLYQPAPLFPGVVCLVALRWLVIDVVAHTADASGLLGRLLPR